MRFVMDGDLTLFGRYCADVTMAEPDHGEIEPILTAQISREEWNWERNSITVSKLIDTAEFPTHSIYGFGDVSFLRDEFLELLEKLASHNVPYKRRGPRPIYDPEIIRSILEIEDAPFGSRTQGELARALADHPEFKQQGLTEAYAEKLVRKFRDT